MSVLRLSPGAALVTAAVLLLAGCASEMSVGTGPQVAAAPPSGAPLPASIPAQDLVGRWGLAAYHKEEDRARTEAAARGQCRQPYNISRGPGGGVVMHLADQSQPTELMLKGGGDGKNYIGPPGPAGGEQDREIVSFDGRVLITRFTDQEVAGRYGTSVYVRCGAEVGPAKKKRPAKAGAPKAPPKTAAAPKG